MALLVRPNEQASNYEHFQFAAQLFSLFGSRFSKTVRLKLSGKVLEAFNQVHRSFVEIQKRLQRGENGFGELLCPETYKLISTYRRAGQNDLEEFEKLVQLSYGIVPFPQKIADLAALERIETVRGRAFSQLIYRLDFKEEERKAGDLPLQPKPLTSEDEMGMTRLYYGAALVWEGTRYMSELILMWEKFDEQNRARHDILLRELSLREWGEDVYRPVINFMSKGTQKPTFARFLKLCSVEAVQKNLGLNLPEGLARILEEKMVCESDRFDLCYFSHDWPRFYELDLSKSGRGSYPLVRSFQLFTFIKRFYEFPQGEEALLLILLLKMDPKWKEEHLPSFRMRKWEQPAPTKAERLSFETAWRGVQDVVRLADPEEERGASFNSPICWDLLDLLWRSDHRVVLVEQIGVLARLPNFKITLPSVLAFWRENVDAYRRDALRFFPENYRDVIDTLRQRGIEGLPTHHILFEPPVSITTEVITRLGFAARNTGKFVESMAPFQFRKGKEYCLMLRQFLLHPNPLSFELLKDAPAIGAEAGEDLLWDLLSKTLPPFEQEGEPLVAARGRARELAAKIEDVYRFSSVQIFSIYVEIIRLVMKGEEVVINQISQVVHELVAFCPAVRKEDIYFLFRYHPKMNWEEIGEFIKIQGKWAADDRELSRFVVDQKTYNLTIEKVEKYVLNLSRACDDEAISNPFASKLQYAILSAIFTPFQPLMDVMRIRNVTAEGPLWGEPTWQTHLGQLKFVLAGASLGVYLHWSILNGHPTLLISFFDLQRGMGVSEFCPLEVPHQEIAPELNRKAFYPLLLGMTSQVLNERAAGDVPKEAPESPESWMEAFPGIRESIEGYATEFGDGTLKRSYVDQIWKFCRKVKLAYRNLYLVMIANRRMAPFESLDTRRVGGKGHIFPSHPRGSLLPISLLQLQTHPEWYLPDGEEEEVRPFRTLFRERREAPQDLRLQLKTPTGNVPISYRVQTAEDLTGDLPPARRPNEVAPPREQVEGRYVTLTANGISIPLKYPPAALEDDRLFQRYFDYHNLLLKAATLQ